MDLNSNEKLVGLGQRETLPPDPLSECPPPPFTALIFGIKLYFN